MNEFNEKGYFCKNDFISKQEIKNLKAEIIRLKDNANTIVYSDRKVICEEWKDLLFLQTL